MGKGVISKIFDWFFHASFSEGNMSQWFAFVIFVMIAGVLWSTVVKEVIGEI